MPVATWRPESLAAALAPAFSLSPAEAEEVVRRVASLQSQLAGVVRDRCRDAGASGARPAALEGLAQAVTCAFWLNNFIDQDAGAAGVIAQVVVAVLGEARARGGG
jgi:hypothetical protein